jgi:hypothetical protein
MSTPNYQAASSPQGHECGICTEKFSDQCPPVPLDNCRHIFCERCIETRMTSVSSNKDKCPEYRTPIGAQFDDAQDNLSYPAYPSRGRGLIVQPEVQPGQIQHNYLNGNGFGGYFYDVDHENIVSPVRVPAPQIRPSTSGRRHHPSGSHHHSSSHHHDSSRHYTDYDDFYNYDSYDVDPFSFILTPIDSLRRGVENNYYVAPAPERRGLHDRLRDVFSGRSSRGENVVYRVASGGGSGAFVVRRPRGTRDTQLEAMYERR